MMDHRGLFPSSFFSEEVRYSDESQIGARTTDAPVASYSGLKANGIFRTGVASPSLEHRIPLDSHLANGFALPDYYLNRGRNVNVSLGRHIVGAERAASHSLPSSVDHNLGSKTNLTTDTVSYLFDSDKPKLAGAQYENGLFSSSLSDLFNRNLKLSSNNAAYGHSLAAGAVTSYCEEEVGFESLEELEAQTIGNLLPDDDDLLSGITDGFDNVIRPNNGEDMEDLDLFSSVGGLELGEDSFARKKSELSDANSNGQHGQSMGLNAGEHPYGEHPSRTLFVRNINSNVEDSELRTLFEEYGDISTMYTACKHRGFVMISYYDIRAACKAKKTLQNKPLRRRELDIHFSIPKDNLSERDINQGSLVVFNLDSSVANDELREIFAVHGEIMEIREILHRPDQMIIEFYDIRAAESALRELNKSEIAGKHIKLEPGRPSGSKRLLHPFSSEQEEDSGILLQQHSTSNNLSAGFAGSLPFVDTTPSIENGKLRGPFSTSGGRISPLLDNVLHHGVSSSVPNSLLSPIRVEPGNQSGAESGHLRNQLKFELQGGVPSPHTHSLPDYHDGLANGHPFGSANNMTANINPHHPEIIDGQQFRRVNSNGKSFELSEVFGSSGNGSCPPPGHHYMWNNLHPHPRNQPVLWPCSPSYVGGINAAHPQQLPTVPRAPSHMLNALLPPNSHHVGSAPSVNPLWDRHIYAGESPDTTAFQPGSLGNMRLSGNSPHPLDFVPHNIFPRDVPVASKNIGLHPHQQRCLVFPARGQMLPMMNSFDSPTERTRNRRNEGSSTQADNKKQFELDIDRILRGEDKRTTLMIKNIPNKYTSKMLLAALDERHRGTYDFIYLPIDFKNKCNVGYAFINMIDPTLIVPFYQTFNGKKWEKFNSEKVASLAYARIQGKAALIAHFQNSSLMNEDKRCRPILFHTDGPNAGDQVPFPVGTNVRPRPGKLRSSSSVENNQEMTPNGEDYSNGDSSSGSGKDSD